MYAIVYTALPILLYGTYDRDISAETCLRCVFGAGAGGEQMGRARMGRV